MTIKELKELKAKKRKIEIAKSYQEFSQRLRMVEWNHPEADWILRLKALIQFHPDHSTRQIINRAQIRSQL